MKRRDRNEMYMMKKVVTVFLERNEMKPLKAFESMVKHYLERGEQIPYYIKSVKDFQNVAREINQKDAIDNMKQEERNAIMNINQKVKSFILESNLQTIKDIRKNFIHSMTEGEKIAITEIMIEKANGEIKENNIENQHINLFKKYLVFE